MINESLFTYNFRLSFGGTFNLLCRLTACGGLHSKVWETRVKFLLQIFSSLRVAGDSCIFFVNSPQDVLMKDATQKTPHESATFSCLYRLFRGEKVRKNEFFGKSVFSRKRRHFRDAAGRFYGLV